MNYPGIEKSFDNFFRELVKIQLLISEFRGDIGTWNPRWMGLKTADEWRDEKETFFKYVIIPYGEAVGKFESLIYSFLGFVLWNKFYEDIEKTNEVYEEREKIFKELENE